MLDYSFLQEVEFESNQINIFREPVFPSLTKKIIDNENYSCFIENEEIKDWVQSNDQIIFLKGLLTPERFANSAHVKTWKINVHLILGSIAKRFLGLAEVILISNINTKKFRENLKSICS